MCRRGAVRGGGVIFCIPCVDRGACDHTANATQSEEPRPLHPPASASNQTSLRRRNWCQDAFTHTHTHTHTHRRLLYQPMAAYGILLASICTNQRRCITLSCHWLMIRTVSQRTGQIFQGDWDFIFGLQWLYYMFILFDVLSNIFFF